jgi:hypothetical protein
LQKIIVRSISEDFAIDLLAIARKKEAPACERLNDKSSGMGSPSGRGMESYFQCQTSSPFGILTTFFSKIKLPDIYQASRLLQ